MTRGRSLLLVGGLVAVLVYLAATMGLIDGDNVVALTLVFAIGPIAAIGALRIGDSLAPDIWATTLRPVTGAWWLFVIGAQIRRSRYAGRRPGFLA